MSLFHVFLVHDTIEVQPVYFPAISRPALDARSNKSISIAQQQQQQQQQLHLQNKPYVMTFEDILIHRLTQKYVGKVVPSCGLCVAVQRIESFSPSMIKGITAAAWLSVTFALCIFSPSKQSRIRAIILAQCAQGIYLTMSQFCAAYPIFIPAKQLVPNSSYDEHQQKWFCLIDQAKDSTNNNNIVINSVKMQHVQRNEYVVGDEVIVRVLSCHVRSLEELEDGCKGLAPSMESIPLHTSSDVQNRNESLSTPSLMEIIVSCVGDGLGPVAWFE